jgi:membrane protease YdiL (CAAX protease family)
MTGTVAQALDETTREPGRLRGWLQVLAVILLLEIGGILGALTGFVPLGPIGSVLLPLLAATYFLRREGTRWSSLVIGSRLSLLAVGGWAALALALVVGLVLAVGPILDALDVPPMDYGLFSALLEGNTVMYLWMLLPVSWGSAAFGEELLVRGFLQHRLTGLAGARVAVLLQAFIFALAHFYQGLGGMVNVFIVGLVFGAIYLRCGRNLVPLFIAHGLIDTFAMTVFYLGSAESLFS